MQRIIEITNQNNENVHLCKNDLWRRRSVSDRKIKLERYKARMKYIFNVNANYVLTFNNNNISIISKLDVPRNYVTRKYLLLKRDICITQ